MLTFDPIWFSFTLKLSVGPEVVLGYFSALIYPLEFIDAFLKASFSIIRVGPSVRPERIALFVNNGMLELSYKFETLKGDFFYSKVQFRKRTNSIFNTRMSVRPF